MSAQVMLKAATVRRVGAALGAEVIGLDLTQSCDHATLDWIRDTLQQHHVLCIRNQALTEKHQLAFSTQLGPLEAFPEKDKTKSESTIYNVANVSGEGQHLPVTDHRVIFQLVNARWHTDSFYR